MTPFRVRSLRRPRKKFAPAIGGTGPRAARPPPCPLPHPGGMDVLPYAAAAVAIATIALLLVVFAGRRSWRRKAGAVGP